MTRKKDIHEFKFETSILHADSKRVFGWHKRQGAFEVLSPPWVEVKVVDQRGGIANGGRVDLKIPFGPLSIDWHLKHRNYLENKQFEDCQIEGPFACWQHTHLFEDEPAGCLIKDQIKFELKSSVFPQSLFVDILDNELQRLFRYRSEVLQNIFSNLQPEVKPMHILVSGSHGLIGSCLIPYLTTQGHKVKRLLRSSSESRPEDIVWDQKRLLTAYELAGVDAIIHLAGENIASGRWDENKKQAIRESRLASTKLICDSIRQLDNPPKSLLCASAIGYYGDTGSTEADEYSAAGSGFLSQLCQDWEKITTSVQEKNVRVVNLRTGVVLSPKGGALAAMLPPFQFGLGGNIGDGKQYMSWIAIDDMANAIYHCLTNNAISGPVNLVAPTAITNAEFTQTMGRVLHRPTILPMPGFAAQLVFGEMANELLLASTRVAPRKLTDSGYQFLYPNLDSCLRHVLGT